MINVNELKIGNLVTVNNEKYHPKLKGVILEVTGINEVTGLDREWTYSVSLKHINQEPNHYYETYSQFIKFLEPIPLTREILQKVGFKGLPHFTVQNSMNINAGRGRVISVACIGTPNEMVFLNEETPPIVKSVIVIRNFDYDGKTYLHHLQNLYFSLTGEELKINL